jgi:hypothetical protein
LLSLVLPERPASEYELALRRMQTACSIIADDHDRLARYRPALALALYRTEQPSAALETLRSVPTVASQSDSSDSALPLTLFVKATCNGRLGRSADARAELEQLRKLIQGNAWAHDQAAHNLLREAEAAIAGAGSG